MFRTLRAVVVALVTVSLVAPLAARAQGTTPTAGCPTTTPAENTTLVTRYWAEVFTPGRRVGGPDLCSPE